MTITEAKKILTDYIGTGPEAEPCDFDEAIRLGAEALIRESNNRINPGAYMDIPLPGETKD